MSNEPLLSPIKIHSWGKAAVFNAAVVYHDGLFRMVYRAKDLGGHEKYGEYMNSLEYTTSEDLLRWQRHVRPRHRSLF